MINDDMIKNPLKKKLPVTSLSLDAGGLFLSVEGQPDVRIHYQMDEKNDPPGAVMCIQLGKDNFYFFGRNGRLIERRKY